MPWVATVARVAIGLVFLVAGVLKLNDYGGTLVSIVAYDLLPYWAARVAAVLEPAGEVSLGLVLLLGVWPRIASLLAATALIGFCAAITSAWARGLTIDCGCFGSSDGAPTDAVGGYVLTLSRNLGLLLLVAVIYRWRAGRLSLDQFIGGRK